ncbi:hypothetical protein [Lactobacillus sp. wkB10]|uniref:hypothetical protein n=1 Tax=Lactobacillus sp. wkB10 TaxID=1545701 RepID=UPI000512E7C8|nr:hypothetical protein [Lactobacillus sp. wkB10]KGG53982.1 hypothetical protein LACWKB10_1202 [Lactobacillus sp. wkB10]
MLMNGKEVNNLIIDGERFARTYDNLIGKKVWIPVNTNAFNSIASIYHRTNSEYNYADWNNQIRSRLTDGPEHKDDKYGQTVTVNDWQMKIGFKPEVAPNSDYVSFWGIWLCVGDVSANGPQSNLWVNLKDVTILQSGGGK